MQTLLWASSLRNIMAISSATHIRTKVKHLGTSLVKFCPWTQAVARRWMLSAPSSSVSVSFQSLLSLYFFLPRMPCNPILLWCTWISFGGPNRSSWCQISALPIRAISVWWCWHSSILHDFLLHLIPKDDLQSQGVPNLLEVSKSLLWQRVIFVCKMYPAFSIKENLQLL